MHFSHLRSSDLRRGFTMIEVLLVIGILSAVTSLSVPLYNEYQIRSDLNLATEQATQGLARARTLAQAGAEDSPWGFYVPSGTLYKGTSYATRDESQDEVYPMPSTITTTQLLEVSYSKGEAAPSATGTVVLTDLSGQSRTITIIVDRTGIPVNATDSLTICHTPPGNPNNSNTLTISDSAWPAHSAHGDTLGACGGGAGSVAASSSAQASSASSAAGGTTGTTAGGAGSSSSAAGSCTDRFSVSSNGTITTTSPLNVTFTVLGSAITYGSGGPEIPVYISASKKATGSPSFTNLFSGNDVDGGEEETWSNVANGSKIVVKIRGKYGKNGWLSFDQSYLSNDQTGHVLTLRDGDTLPNYAGFSGQGALESFLTGYVNAQHEVTIGQYDVLLLVELGSIGSPMPASADFQDAVVLVSFEQSPGACN